ncbi:MAG: alpha-glucan family phosphorylase [Planctomycetes bacterium]|nr:alpha-glucan family phosphorylase [Planctomycetota bacterium]
MTSASMAPDVLFEVSWEVANMVGGIHTVLATKVRAMQQHYGDDYVVVGPDRGQNKKTAFLEEDVFEGFGPVIREYGLPCRQGRWDIPGRPRCLLVGFTHLYEKKDLVLAKLWEDYQVDSIEGGWDYVEPVLFGHAAGQAIELYVRHYFHLRTRSVVAHCHEWLTGSTLLYLARKLPAVGTVFTTHATILGRSVSGTGEGVEVALARAKPMALAAEKRITPKHSMEVAAAREADCFTTVSRLTALEAARILGRDPDFVVPNALGEKFPQPEFALPASVAASRRALQDLLLKATGRPCDPARTVFLMSSGRYEYHNKGIDLLLDAVGAVARELPEGREIALFLLFPSSNSGPNRAVMGSVASAGEAPRVITHDLRYADDPVLAHLKRLGLDNRPESRARVLFIPIYLDGKDPLVDRSYYELLPAFDLTVFPSRYEPWGYTPLESAGYGVPSVTSDLAGFGLWARDQGPFEDTGVYVLPREGKTPEESRRLLSDFLLRYVSAEPGVTKQMGALAKSLARRASWPSFGVHYLEAHARARSRAGERSSRTRALRRTGEKKRAHAFVGAGSVEPHLRSFTVTRKLPREFTRLGELAANLWWSWNPDALSLFADLSPDTWNRVEKRPTRFLESVSQREFDRAAASPEYMDRYSQVLARFDAYRKPLPLPPEIGYFCAEFGIAECLPFYAGGMGILAGDHLKTASDLGIPLVAVGLAYRQGYFRQRLDAEGNQLDLYEPAAFTSMPMAPVLDAEGKRLRTTLALPGRTLHLQAWRVDVGNVPLFLLDTDISENVPEDRAITSRLYGGAGEARLKQEIVLGLGGEKFLREAGLAPLAYHMNEGHSAFLVLARLGHLVGREGLKYEEALQYARQTSIFTTHTPVPAGHDEFPEDLMRPYFREFEGLLRRSWEDILALGQWPGRGSRQPFSMTLLAIRGSGSLNGVSRIHGDVARKMFSGLRPGYHASEVPVEHVTNGVHIRTWIAPEYQELFASRLGADWTEHLEDPLFFERLRNVPDEEFWRVHALLREGLLDRIASSLRDAWRLRRDSPELLDRILDGIDPASMIVGFARRFAPYKRSTLLFKNPRALERLLGQPDEPVILLFAGKAHPADGLGREMLREVFQASRREPFLGKIIFLEGYDISLARALVAGCDVWLNTPTRPLEASGTSGIKAAVNGCLNLSVEDGWWAEAANGRNGWSIEGEEEGKSADYRNEQDVHTLYHLLLREVAPLYFRRDAAGLPREWIARMKESMISIVPRFSSHRMVGQYRRRYYSPARVRAETLPLDSYLVIREGEAERHRLTQAWGSVRFESVEVTTQEREDLPLGEPVDVSVRLEHPGITPAEILVQVVFGAQGVEGEIEDLAVHSLAAREEKNGTSLWKGSFAPSRSGPHAYGVRVVPRQSAGNAQADMELGLVKWA